MGFVKLVILEMDAKCCTSRVPLAPRARALRSDLSGRQTLLDSILLVIESRLYVRVRKQGREKEREERERKRERETRYFSWAETYGGAFGANANCAEYRVTLGAREHERFSAREISIV